MEEGKIRYAGHNIKWAVKCLYMINHTLHLLTKGASKFSDRDMAKKIIPRNLSRQKRFEFIVNGAKCLRKKSKIMTHCQRFEKLIDIKSEFK